MNPFTRYLMSNGNLAGCAAAATMTVLYLVGVIDSYWGVLSVVAYGAAAVGFGRSAPPKQLPQGLDTQVYLDWLRTQALPKLTGEASASLQRILDTATELWPRLKELQDQGLVQVENRTMLKQTLTQLLPEMVTNYLQLPAVYARTYKVNGKTPQVLLEEQLTLLESHVMQIRDGVYSREVDKLLANGRFLQEKFDQSLRIG
jgi:hypothetical protein